MRLATLLVLCPWLATILFWLTFAACIDSPPSDIDDPQIARVVVAWDPLACTDDAAHPLRVVVELEDHAGIKLSASTPCRAGSLALDAPHYGTYYGRTYGWAAGETIRSVVPVRLVVDEPIVRWLIATPP